jgi:pimeloyl-ACP methyl ester carboxylesterase
MRARTVAALAAGATVFAGYEALRRRDLRAVRADPARADLAVPLEGRPHSVRSADGTRLHVEVFGPDDAPSIVLVHGWVEAIRLWSYQIRDLSRDFRMVAYDQRGHGGSEAPQEGGYTDAALADDLQAVLDACVPAGSRCVVAGHYMGGMTVVAWAGRHAEDVPRRLGAAALINTGMNEMLAHTAVLGGKVGERMHAAILPALFATEMALPTRFDPISYRVVRRIAFAPSASPARVAFGHDMFTAAAAPVRAGFGRMFIPLDLTPSVACLTVPTVVVAGDRDRLLPRWHSDQLVQALPNVVDYSVLSTGHMSMLEAPQAINERLRRLLDTYAGPVAATGKRVRSARRAHTVL